MVLLSSRGGTLIFIRASWWFLFVRWVSRPIIQSRDDVGCWAGATVYGVVRAGWLAFSFMTLAEEIAGDLGSLWLDGRAGENVLFRPR